MRLGPYEVQSLLGEGGRGAVYRAKEPRIGRSVAVKVLPARLVESAEALRRFEAEARAGSAVNHPNLLSIYDVGTHEGTPYVVSELLDGKTLRALMAGWALPPAKAIDVARQIAAGLAAAHDAGIVHRDLKPDNVF